LQGVYTAYSVTIATAVHYQVLDKTDAIVKVNKKAKKSRAQNTKLVKEKCWSVATLQHVENKQNIKSYSHIHCQIYIKLARNVSTLTSNHNI